MKENDIEEGFWVFLSHSTKDFDRVRLVRNALEDSGFRPILFYLKCMENEDEINGLLKREIDARHRFILCDSPNAQASRYVQSEVDYIRSKKRMYEVIDLSQVDMKSPNVEKDVLNLIKPFKRRASVFISYHDSDREFAKQLEEECLRWGFKAWDMDFYDWQIPGNAPSVTWDFLTRRSIEATLDNGYLIGLISKNSSEYGNKLIEYALGIDTSRTLPIVIDDIATDQLPVTLRDKQVLNLSDITSSEEKAKAIVERLIVFDINFQYG